MHRHGEHLFFLVVYRYPANTNRFQQHRFQQNTFQAPRFPAPHSRQPRPGSLRLYLLRRGTSFHDDILFCSKTTMANTEMQPLRTGSLVPTEAQTHSRAHP